MECPNTKACPIYEKFRTEALKNVYIRKYCTSNFEDCKRKQMKDTGNPVPPKLLPDGRELGAL